jgi:hypothetical protein
MNLFQDLAIAYRILADHVFVRRPTRSDFGWRDPFRLNWSPMAT